MLNLKAGRNSVMDRRPRRGGRKWAKFAVILSFTCSSGWSWNDCQPVRWIVAQTYHVC